MYPIISSQELAPAINKLIVKAPLIARKRRPGNFVILRAVPTGERIPLTIVDSDPDEGTITLILQSIGKTTMLINSMKAGDELIDVAGPLGEPTPVENHGTVVCIGGGVGTAVVYPIAKALSEAGNDVISIIGARNAQLVILEEEMKAVSRDLMITTDDGSAGRKGFVTDVLKEILDRPGILSAGSGAVYAMGPMPMMRAVSGVTRDTGIRTWVSLNPIMMDGTGMCGACRVTVGDQLKFACVDGPEFDGHQINFDELIARNRTYADLEKKALETCKSLQT